ILAVEEETEQVNLTVSPIGFTPWSIVFRDFLRLLYWFPRTPSIAEAVLDFFGEPYVVPDEREMETIFKLEPRPDGQIGCELVVWQPSHPDEPAVSIQEAASLIFSNLLVLGLFER